MAQQTATEWICMQLLDFDNHKIWPSLLERAKHMEKEQILDAYEQGAIDGRFEMFSDNTVHNAEAYYNKTFTE